MNALACTHAWCMENAFQTRTSLRGRERIIFMIRKREERERARRSLTTPWISDTFEQIRYDLFGSFSPPIPRFSNPADRWELSKHYWQVSELRRITKSCFFKNRNAKKPRSFSYRDSSGLLAPAERLGTASNATTSPWPLAERIEDVESILKHTWIKEITRVRGKETKESVAHKSWILF